MKLKFNGFLVLFLVLVAQLTFAQERAVSGIVSDDAGMPLPGVSVLVKGTKTGTQTDFDGKFSIKVSPSQILVFSYIGMKSQEVAATSTSINIKLADNSVELESVVVTALGIKKSDKAVGYATTKLSGNDITKGNNQNVVSALSGKVSGLQVTASGGAPGQASRLVIRGGNKSLTGANEPLYVIDGIPMSNANDGNGNTVIGFNSPNRASDINPNDIASVTILKGAAGAVLYGNRGSNGVVLITTKTGSGKEGKPVIEFNSSVGVDDALVLPDFQTEYAQGSNGVTYAEGGSRSFGPRITGQTVTSAAAGAAQGLGPQQIQLKVYDPRKQFLQTGTTYNNNVSLSNSTDAYDMFVSVGQSKQTSIVPNQGYQKFNGRFNSNYKFSSKFTAGVNLSYNASEGDLAYAGQDGGNPFFALFHTPVSWDLKGYGYERPNGTQINFRGGAFDNPYWSAYKNSARTDSQRYITGLNFAFDVAKDFKLSYRLGNDHLSDERTLFKDIYTGGNPLGNLTYDNITRQETTSTLIATFNKDITEKFKATLTAGQDYNKRTFQQTQTIGTELILPGIINTNNIKTFSPAYLYNSKRTLFGVFGDLSLSYDSYLFLNVVARNEWSSTLPKDNRSFFYPGVSASLIFTDAFKIQSDALTYGKLRVGASKTGRDADPYLTQPAYRKAIFGDGFTDGVEFPFNNLAGYTIQNTISNANLTPEFTTEYEVGVELKLFKDRIGIDASYYRNVNTDGIIPLDISPATGATATIINSGQTSSKGFELMLRTTPIQTKNFKWDVSFNFSRVRSHVDETYPGVDKIYLGGFDGNPAIYAVKGERLGTIIGTGYARDANGKVLVDDDGIPSVLDGVNLGHTEADWTGGLSTAINYKNIYFTALADIRQGGYLYSGTGELLDFYGVSKETLNRNDDYIFPGVNATTGAANDVVVKRDANWYGLGAYPNEQYVYENNWVKLREVTLGYTFKLKDKYIRSLDIGVYGRNLFIWTDVPHIDPESSSFGTGNAQGVSRFAFPTTRSFGFNLKAQF
ncbi:SusC/RagA family TonB-linked outer membrane protein [Flavobacterium reichenbachii]|uniref:SusC/RagA family TonB-linked outer membrane protein n=1 Tax=Flavobacterium reichenbachii TaxID=362418 RepID=UPI00068C9DA1|nr:SusC/RagA family TonB-linked outer membrane protein [Flavobacterium reichenbachii]OXB16053.1 SusC/RagA family TonB-linked outer membrane protein [Flavobacterium reichenbachii]